MILNKIASKKSLLRLSVACGTLVLTQPAMAQDAAETAETAETIPQDNRDDIIVTATRRSASIADVPISISAFSTEQMDRQGIKNIADVARLTPGVNFNTAGLRQNSISIRGISSAAGASTTGIYLDETPIQARLLGNSASNVFPRIFDLERVEVLRGPQGTLFGAGAQGGAVRFITNSASTTETKLYARGEVAVNAAGGTTYEAGASLSVPVIDDVLGLMVSAWFRRDGGYIDRRIGTINVIDPTGAAGPEGSLNFVETGTAYENSNWEEATVLRAALTFTPTDTLTIKPAIHYQDEFAHDRIRGYWPTLSEPGSSDFAIPLFAAGSGGALTALPADAPRYDPLYDEFILGSLQINWDLGPAELVSNTAYFDREQTFFTDFTYTHVRTYAAYLNVPQTGYRSYGEYYNTQTNWSQELRLQSTGDGPLSWVFGGFYSHNEQIGNQDVYNNFYLGLPRIGTSGRFGVTDGAPFGPGYSAFENYFGMGLVDGRSYVRVLNSVDEQIAVFGQVDYKPVEWLTLTAGLRYAHATFEYDTFYDGPSNNLNTPQGLACVPGTGRGTVPCQPVPVGAFAPATGPFTPSFVNDSGRNSEDPITPKFGIEIRPDDDHMFYGSISRGFRVGGAQGRLPSACDAQLIDYGYVDENGNASSPNTFSADTVWSYEVGAKNTLLGGALQLATSAYYIKWDNIQSTVGISACTQSFVDNLGSATSKGADLMAILRPLPGLQLSGSVAYNDTSFDDPTLVGTRTLYSEGSALPDSGAPWTVNLGGQYYVPVGSGDTEVYGRVDYTYNSRWRRTGATDPLSVTYDRMLSPRPATHFVSVRAGVEMGELDVSLFVDNLLNAAPDLELLRSNNTPLYTNITFRPRTIGLTTRFRY